MYGLSAITTDGGTASPTIPIVNRHGAAAGLLSTLLPLLRIVSRLLPSLLPVSPVAVPALPAAPAPSFWPALVAMRSNRVYTLSPGLTGISLPVAAFAVKPQLAASEWFLQPYSPMVRNTRRDQQRLCANMSAWARTGDVSLSLSCFLCLSRSFSLPPFPPPSTSLSRACTA